MDLAPARTDSFPAIADYGVIGNLETVAYIANTGAVEFFAYPNFDSPTIFAAMLGREAGAFTLRNDIAPTGTQQYLPDTNVLVTRFDDGARVLEVTDFMPLGGRNASNQLVRIVTCHKGEVRVNAVCAPRPDYGRLTPELSRDESGTTLFTAERGPALHLGSSAPVTFQDGAASLSETLGPGQSLVLSLICDGMDAEPVTPAHAEDALADTIAAWREWAAKSTYTGVWRDAVTRSALALKLMFSAKHGSIVAAPTFGLPEAIGGTRNFDYRYCWVRDSAFTVYAMLRLGFREEAENYRGWIGARMEECDEGALQLMYRLDGSTDGLDEETLGHLQGYRGSTPVRIGNAAFSQTQIDIYGEIVDSLYITHKELGTLSDGGWAALARSVDYVCANWRTPGAGIWEMRDTSDLFIDAVLMTWVATDRAIRLADKTGNAPNPKWAETRDETRQCLLTEFWDETAGTFTQRPGSGTVDAVTLMMPLVKFLPTTDPRFRRTMDTIEARLVDGPLVRRYETEAAADDGFEGPAEGAFVTCSFWWIECLARSSRVDEAKALFEKMLGHASPAGLYSEELGPDGLHLGNTPQALSHLAMISAAIALDRAMTNGGKPF
ncbi:glycoside hydrolase family 15 protein [Acuticoccus sp. MNP-M23]|uniref:glycoside hydrolase family 15 protein n=1 Tax=Acuticoccus sp. MNP-M23 TaxID=3072793 RepID=UPI002814FE83|nr:glycoside hydrolase family 15 protein [Acuticoccus sp. MNP-M23]WMS40793.1 glycoside hydrolase family 15 protein [Acuticoccus sp. MNP-M23]